MKRAVALGYRSAAARTTACTAAASRLTVQSAAVAASTAAPHISSFSSSQPSALLEWRIAHTRRGRVGPGGACAVLSPGVTWDRASGRTDLPAVSIALPHLAFPSGGPLPSAATAAADPCAASATAAAGLLLRRAQQQQRLYPHLDQWSTRYLTAHHRCLSESARSSGGSEPPPGRPAEPTQAPQHQQHAKQEGAADLRSSTRKISGISGGAGGAASGSAAAKGGYMVALWRFAFAAAKKLTKLLWR